MIRGLSLSLSQKASLSGIFMLASLDIFLDIFRTFYTTNTVGVQNLWEVLEITIAVMLSALITYRQLFGMWRKRTRSQGSSSSRFGLLWSKFSKDSRNSKNSRDTRDTASQHSEHTLKTSPDRSKSDAYYGVDEELGHSEEESVDAYGGVLNSTPVPPSATYHPVEAF